MPTFETENKQPKTNIFNRDRVWVNLISVCDSDLDLEIVRMKTNQHATNTSRWKVIYFKSYIPHRHTPPDRHTHPIDRCTWTTKVVGNNHRVTICHRSWRHRRLETERWPPLKSININTRRDIQSSLWLVKHLPIGWLINIPPFFGFQ